MIKKIAFAITLCVAALSMSAASQEGVKAIKAGNILHCFNWKYTDIQAELQNIRDAGFTAIQTSPAQTNYTGSTSWNTLYRPRDSKAGPNTLGTSAELKALCTAAHEMGLYIIVDVVANHTDGSGSVYSGVADFWKDLTLYHDWSIGSANDNSRYSVTHGNIGMMDLKTEDSRVQAKFKEYIQELKSLGVDGCRFDGAKHIGLPSEGDDFWPSVIDSDMFNYGEILNCTGGDTPTLLKEYLQYMSVTDNTYGTYQVLAAFKNGSVPTVDGCWCYTTNSTDFVYWGESHDTFANNGDASYGVDQSVVDRAYAVAAARNGIPALYLSRPNGGNTAGPGSTAGSKGSTHFTSKCVAEVNNYKTICAGEADYYSGSGSVCSITRKSGAVMVNAQGAGSITATNGGGYLTPGVYTDHVSGNTFTVTSSTISGTTDATGIAVLYDGSVATRPYVTLSPNGGSFTTETTTVTATLYNATSGWYKIDGGTQHDFTGTATITIGEGVDYGKTTTITWSATNDTETATGSATFTKKDPSATAYIYFNNTADWSNVYVYNWKNGTETNLGGWPGNQLTDTTSEGYYKYEVTDESYDMIIFNDGGNNQTSNLSLIVGHLYSPAGDQGVYTPSGDNPDDPSGNDYEPTLDSSDEISVFFEGSSATLPKVWIWTSSANYTGGTWPGVEMTQVGKTNAGNYVFKWKYDGNETEVPTGLIFTIDGTKVFNQDLTFVNHGYYTNASTSPIKTITKVKGNVTGDVNGDGIVDVTDVTTLMSVILGTGTSTSICDVNGDGIVDISDITTILKIILAI